MKDFLKLLSFLISMMGCLLVGAVLALKGASVLTIAYRAAIALVVLWIVLSFLTSVLSLVATPHREVVDPDVEDGDEDQVMAEAS